MASTKRKPKIIDEYLAGVNASHRAALEKVRKTTRHGIPAFRLNGRSLLFFGAWANHCAFYPGRSATLKKFRNELRDFETSKGTLRFSPDKPLPVALVKKLVKARIAEIRG